jgi:hypothetical protein
VLTVEAGQNSATRGRGITLIDASVSVHAIPGLRLRAGQFKLPTMDETLEANPLAADFVNVSPLVSQLLLEQPVKDGAFAGPSFANRDVGIQAFDSFLVPAGAPVVGNHLEIAYAAALSQGQAGGVDVDVHKDFTVRAMASWLPTPADRYKALREEISAFAWHLEGKRVADGDDVDRVRQGLGLQARLFHARARVEIVGAAGMLFTGQNPAFDGQPIVVDPNGEAWGFSAAIGVEQLGPFEFDARLDQLSRAEVDDPGHRLQRNVTLGGQYKWTENVKLMLNWELRHIGVGANTPVDAKRVADSVGDVVVAQLTVLL